MLCRKIASESTGTYVYFKFNSTSDFVDLLRNHTYEERPWFIHKKAKWNKDIEPSFAEILTQNGIGYTFNLMDQSELLHASR